MINSTSLNEVHEDLGLGAVHDHHIGHSISVE
jgi:hypothetical protein